MNTIETPAEHKARKAELECYLLRKYNEGNHNYFGDFDEWLKDQLAPDNSDNWEPWKVFSKEARMLVNFYNEGV